MSEAQITDIMRQLGEPFPVSHLEWKPGGKPAKGKNGLRVKVLAYLNDDRIRDRLDDVVGPTRWHESYGITERGAVCSLSVAIGNPGDVVSRQFAAGYPSMADGQDEAKGACTYAFRACYGHAFCRYLWFLPEHWVGLEDGWGPDTAAGRVKHEDKWYHFFPPQMPEWALPGGSGRPTTEEEETGQAILGTPQPGSNMHEPRGVTEERRAISEWGEFKGDANGLEDTLRESLIGRAKEMMQDAGIEFDPKKVTQDMRDRVHRILTIACGQPAWSGLEKAIRTEDPERVREIMDTLKEQLK